MSSATAVFKAVADFNALNREIDKTSAKMAVLKAQGADPASAKSFEASMARMADSQKKLRAETDKLNDSRAKSIEIDKKSITSSGSLHKTHVDAAEAARSYQKDLSSTERVMRDLHSVQQDAQRSAGGLRSEHDKGSTTASKVSTQLANLSKVEREAAASAEKHVSSLKSEQKIASSKAGTLSKLTGHLKDVASSEDGATTSAVRHADSLGKEATALAAATLAHRAHATAIKATTRATNATGSVVVPSAPRGSSSSPSSPVSQPSSSGGLVSALAGSLKDFSSSSKEAEGSAGALKAILIGLVAPSLPALVSTLIGSIVALAGSLIGVIGAAAPAAGAVAAFGPAALAAGGAAGTLALSLFGVGNALTALIAVQQGASQTARAFQIAMTSAMHGLVNAQDAVTASKRAQASTAITSSHAIVEADLANKRSQLEVTYAVKALEVERRQATRDLVDLKNATIDATLAEEGSNISLIEAQKRLADVNSNVASTGLQKREAALQVASAQQKLTESQLTSTRAVEDSNRAQALGVDGAQSVVAATQRVADAKKAETDAAYAAKETRRVANEETISANLAVVHSQRALQAAMDEVHNTLTNQTSAQIALAQAMAKLSPAGQQFVYFLNSLLPLLYQLSGVAQTAFLPGLETAIRILLPMIYSVAIPSIKAFGAVLSEFVINGAKLLTSFTADFVSFGTGAGPALVKQFGQILLNFASALLNITFAAVPLAQWLSTLALQFSEYIKNTTEAARKSGELAAFFDRVKATLILLGGIIYNVGGILHSVFSAAAPMGERLLQTFKDITEKTNAYLKSTEGIAKLKKYFDDMEPIIRIVFNLLDMIFFALLRTGSSKTTEGLLRTVQDVLVPALQRLSEAMGKLALAAGTRLVELLSKLADVFTNLLNAGGGGGFAAFFSVLDAFASALRAITEVPFLAHVGLWLLAIAGGMKAIKVLGAITGLSKLAGGLNTVAGRAASYAAGEAAPVKGAPATLTKGIIAGVAGTTATPKTLTARAGVAVGGYARQAFGLAPGVRGVAGPVVSSTAPAPTASPVAGAPVASAAPTSPGAATVPYPPGTSRSPSPVAPSRVRRVAGAVGRGALAVGGVGAGIAGSIGGGVAGAAIGGRLGGATGSEVGGIAGSIAGSFAPSIISAGLAKISPLISNVKSGLGGLASTLSGSVAGAAKGAVGGLLSMAGAAGSAAGSLLRAAGGYVALGVEAAISAGKQLLAAAAAGVVKGAVAAWTAVQWLLNVALDANPIGLIVLLIAGLVAAFVFAWTHSETFRNIVMGALQAVGDFFKFIWERFISPVFDRLVIGFKQIGDAATWLYNNAIKPAWDGIGWLIGVVWNTVIKPLFEFYMDGFRQIGAIATDVWHVIETAWNGLGGVISGVWTGVIKPAWDAIMVGLKYVENGFTASVNAIGTIWNNLRGYMARPINFMIDTVWNGGIVKAWNLVAGILPGMKPIPPLGRIPEMAVGGQVPGVGDKDTVPALLTPGEYVISKPVVEKWGLNNIHAAHLAARSGSFKGLEGMFSGEGDSKGIMQVGRFAGGGPVGLGVDFAKAQHGKPYIWGGVGPAGFDCSGFMSAITNILLGRNAYQRLGTTYTAPWAGFNVGLNSAFGIGVSQEHMAGTIDGHNVEAGGSPSMVKFVDHAAGATHPQFNKTHMSLPQAGGIFVGGPSVGAGSGPDVSWIKAKIAGWVTDIINPVINKLPVAPPALQGVPRDVSIKVRDTALDWFMGQANTATGTNAAGGVSGGDHGTGPAVDQVRGVATRYGWGSGTEWDDLYKLVMKESSWNVNAANSSSSARGLFQKMTSIHGPVESTAAGQAEWGLNYIKGRYGDPIAAWAHETANNWYAKGGPVKDASGNVPAKMLADGGWVDRFRASESEYKRDRIEFPLRLGQRAPHIARFKDWLGLESSDGREDYFGSDLYEALRGIQSIFGVSPTGWISEWAYEAMRRAHGAPPIPVDPSGFPAGGADTTGFAAARAAFDAQSLAHGAPAKSLNALLNTLRTCGSIPGDTRNNPLSASQLGNVDGVVAKLPAIADAYGGTSAVSQQVAAAQTNPAAAAVSGTGDDLQAYLTAVSGTDANTKEFESDLLILEGWGLQDLALSLQKKGVGTSTAPGSTAAGTASADAGGLILARQAVANRTMATAADAALKDQRLNTLGGHLEVVLRVIGKLAAKENLGIRDVSLSTKYEEAGEISPKDIFMAMRYPRAISELAKLPPNNTGKFNQNMQAYALGVPFATGGRVGGIGFGDTVPAMLTPGEFVIRQKAATALGPKRLDALNKAHTLPWVAAMEAGGPVAHAADLFAPVMLPHIPKAMLGSSVTSALKSATASLRGGDTHTKSTVFEKGAVQISNPAPQRAVDSFENTMRKLNWTGVMR